MAILRGITGNRFLPSTPRKLGGLLRSPLNPLPSLHLFIGGGTGQRFSRCCWSGGIAQSALLSRQRFPS